MNFTLSQTVNFEVEENVIVKIAKKLSISDMHLKSESYSNKFCITVQCTYAYHKDKNLNISL